MGQHRLNRRQTHGDHERRSGKIHGRCLALALLGLAAIVFVTLCPIGLRPHLGSPFEERFGAYFVLGLLAAFALPRRQAAVSLSIVAIAFGLEAAQRLVPTRDAALPDAVVKAFGGVAGVQCAALSFAVRRWLRQAYHRRTRSRVGARAM